jgi:hypothetical protein
LVARALKRDEIEFGPRLCDKTNQKCRKQPHAKQPMAAGAMSERHESASVLMTQQTWHGSLATQRRRE